MEIYYSYMIICYLSSNSLCYSTPQHSKSLAWHMHFGRNTYTKLVRLMFNHGRFPSDLFKIGIFDRPVCIYCNLDEGTTNHLIFNYTKFKKESAKLLNYLFASGLTSPFNITNLLASEGKKSCIELPFFHGL